MGTSSRELKVRFVGDAADLKGTFSEVSAGAAQSGAQLRGLDNSANTVGKSFLRSGKVLKGAGRAFKASGLDAASAASGFLSTIPALSGVSAGLGQVVVGASALGPLIGSLGAVALPAVGAAALVAGAAFVLLRGNASWADAAIRELNDANHAAAAASHDAAAAATAQAGAVRDLAAAGRGEERAKFSLIDATKAYNDEVAKSGRHSRASREALLDVRDAEAAVGDAKRAGIRAAQEGIRAVEKSNKASREEVASARAAVVAAKQKTTAMAQGFLGTKGARAAVEALAVAERRQAAASKAAEARHRTNAAAARTLAGSINGADSASQKLRGRLQALSKQELNMANAIAALSRLSSMAGGAATQVQRVASMMAALDGKTVTTNVVTRTQTIPSGKRAAEFPSKKASNEFGNQTGIGGGLRAASPGSPLNLERIGNRGDRTARQAKLNAESAADRGGKSAGEIRAAGDAAYANARLATIKNLKNKIATRYGSLVKKLGAARKALRGTKVPKGGTPKRDKARQKALDRRAKLQEQINGYLDEMETLAANDADLTVEANELGEDLKAIARDAAAAESDAAAEAADTAAEAAANAPTAMDALEAAAAEAALTPGTEDDLAAARAIETQRGHELNAARASGDPRLVAAAAQALLAARQAREQLEATGANTDALNANTEAMRGFGGSNVVAYRGQDHVLRSLAPPSSDRLVGVETGI